MSVAEATVPLEIRVGGETAKYLRIVGEPTRFRILGLLRETERSVSELAAALGSSQSKVSNHLACLRWCGLVETRREHRTIYYRLADPRLNGLVDLAAELAAGSAEAIRSCERVDRGSCA